MAVHQGEKGKGRTDPLLWLCEPSAARSIVAFPPSNYLLGSCLERIVSVTVCTGEVLLRLSIGVVTWCLLQTAFYFRTVANIESYGMSPVLLVTLNQTRVPSLVILKLDFLALPWKIGAFAGNMS